MNGFFHSFPFAKGEIFSGSSLVPLWKLWKRGRGDLWPQRFINYSTNFRYATLAPDSYESDAQGRALRPEPMGLGSPNDPDYYSSIRPAQLS
jgi:hypothetical protein